MALATCYRILVASNMTRITSLLFNPYGPSRATLNVTSETTVGTRPMWITGHPTNPSLAFTGLGQNDGMAIALKYDGTGNGTIVGEIPSGGAVVAFLLATTDTLFVANYGSGTFMAAPLSASPPYFLDEPSRAVLHFNGSGPNTDRQQSSHPHDVVAIPGRTEIVVPDLGADRAWRLAYDEGRSALSVQDEVMYPPGSGPRHAVFYEDILYTITELTSNLTAHRLPPLPASSKLFSITSTLQLQPGESLGDRAAAELLLAPALRGDGRTGSSSSSGDGGSCPKPFLYATNRNDPSPEGDPLAIFSLEDPAAPALIREVYTGLHHLRGAAIGGEDGQYIIMGGMLGGGVKMYERIEGGRALMEIAALPTLEGSTGFLWLRQETCTISS